MQKRGVEIFLLILIIISISFFFIDTPLLSPEEDLSEGEELADQMPAGEQVVGEEAIYLRSFEQGEIDPKKIIDLLQERASSQFPEEIQRETVIDPAIYEELQNGRARVIVKLRGNYYLPSLDEIKQAVLENQESVFSYLNEQIDNTEDFELIFRYELVNGFAAYVTQAGLEALSKNENVEGIFLDQLVPVALPESVPLINADDVQSKLIRTNPFAAPHNILGSGETVCVIDTGIDYTHPALAGRVTSGWDFVDNDPDAFDDPLPGTNGHGTKVAGVVAANGVLAGNPIKGVAPGANLIAVRVCEYGCLDSSHLGGIDYCISNLNTLGTDAITISIGTNAVYSPTTTPCSSYQTSATSQYLFNLASYYNIPVTIGSGNSQQSTGISWPACSNNVISVGAVTDGSQPPGYSGYPTITDVITGYTNTGTNLDVLAPAQYTTSTTNQPANPWVTFDGGTSMAAPHVAGTIALYKQANPSLTPYQLESILKSTGVPITDPDNLLTFPRIDSQAGLNEFTSSAGNIRLTDLGTSGSSTLVIDSQGNNHIMWIDGRDGTAEIYYKKLDSGGNVLIGDTRLTYNTAYETEISLDVDSQGNLHLVYGVSFTSEIYYAKLNNNGNFIVQPQFFSSGRGAKIKSGGTTVPYVSPYIWVIWSDAAPSTYYPPNSALYIRRIETSGFMGPIQMITNPPAATYPPRYSNNPSLDISVADGTINVVWEDNRDGNWEIYYKKIAIGGIATYYSEIIGDLRLTYNNANSKKPIIKTPDLSNKFIFWEDERDGRKEVYYTKLDYYGNTMIDDTPLYLGSTISQHPSIDSGYEAGSSSPSINIAWQDQRDHLYGEIYHMKIDSDANVLIPMTRLTNELVYSGKPFLDTNGGSPSIVWENNMVGNNRDIFYKQQSPSQNELVLNPTPFLAYNDYIVGQNQQIVFQINGKFNANQNYIVALSWGDSPGLNYVNHQIPLNADNLFGASLTSPTMLGFSSNSQGTLNSQGRATVFLTIPNMPSLSGQEFYANVIMSDSQGYVSGISNSVKINII